MYMFWEKQIEKKLLVIFFKGALLSLCLLSVFVAASYIKREA